MMKLISFILLLALAASLTVSVNNIHYGYRNIYLAQRYTLTASNLQLIGYKITKSELTPDVITFISTKDNEASFDLSVLVRQFEAEDIDPTAPMLTFRFLEKPHIVLSIFSENENETEIELINLLTTSGLEPSALDL